MIRQLSPIEIDDLLRKQIVGRIGCSYENEVYIIPMSYAYDDDYVYCHSYEGKKMEMMRKNPKVCFQVDEMKDMGNWKSVIAWGEYQELTDSREKQIAMKLFVERTLSLKISETAILPETSFERLHPRSPGVIKPIIYRIILKEKTGRYETD